MTSFNPPQTGWVQNRKCRHPALPYKEEKENPVAGGWGENQGGSLSLSLFSRVVGACSDAGRQREKRGKEEKTIRQTAPPHPHLAVIEFSLLFLPFSLSTRNMNLALATSDANSQPTFGFPAKMNYAMGWGIFSFFLRCTCWGRAAAVVLRKKIRGQKTIVLPDVLWRKQWAA